MLKKKIGNEKTVEELIAAGRNARAHGLLTEAIKNYQSALTLGLSSPDEEASVRCLLAEAFEKAGLYRELFSSVSKYDGPAGLRQLSRRTSLLVLVQLGWSHSRNGDIPRAIATFNQVLRTAQPDDLAIIAACHTGLGRAYRVYSEIQFARDHYTIAIEYYRRIGDLSGLSESYMGLSYVDLREGAYQDAFVTVNTALGLLRGSKDAFCLGAAYEILAVATLYLDDLISLPAIFNNCLENARKTGALTGLMNTTNNYATFLTGTGEWARGEEIAKYALEIASQMSNPAYVASCHDTLAQIYMLQGRISEADELLTESIRLITSITAGEWAEIAIQMTIGRLCLFKGQPDQAVIHTRRSITIGEKLGVNQFRPDALVWLAEALMEKGMVEEAKSVIETNRSELRRSPNIDAWGHLTRTIAKSELVCLRNKRFDLFTGS